MRSLIQKNWIILFSASIVVAAYVWITEGFFAGKAYMFFLLAVLFGFFYWRGIKNGFK